MLKRIYLLLLFPCMIISACSDGVSYSPWPPGISPGHVLKINCDGDSSYSVADIDGWPIVVVCRSPQDIERLDNLNDKVLDPEAGNKPGRWLRSARDDVFVVIGVSPYSRCTVKIVPEGSLSYAPDWPGGFIDPCRDAAWDMAGRQIKAPSGYSKFVGNLTVPKYSFISDTAIKFE